MQTPAETLVPREVDADALVDNSRKISRFGAVYTDFKRFQNENTVGMSVLPLDGNTANTVDFRYTILFTGSKFLGSKFPGSKFLGSKFPGSKFLGFKFLGSKFPRSKFLGSKFLASKFLGSRFLGSRFLGSWDLGS